VGVQVQILLLVGEQLSTQLMADWMAGSAAFVLFHAPLMAIARSTMI